MVITRYLYKPTASEGLTRFNDNKPAAHLRRRRRDQAGQAADHAAITTSTRSTGRRRATRSCSSRTARPTPIASSTTTSSRSASRTATVRRLTDTKNAEYRPVWSPDGKPIAYLGHQAAAHLLGDDDGGHARVGDGRATAATGTKSASDRQPPGPAAVVADGSSVLLHACRSAAATRLYQHAGRRRHSRPSSRRATSAVSVGSWSVAKRTARRCAYAPSARRHAGRAVRQARATPRRQAG